MLFRDLLRDLQFALRQLRNNPGFSLLAVGTLALGIAANITIFSWINSTLLDPIPGVAHTREHDYDHARGTQRTSHSPILVPRLCGTARQFAQLRRAARVSRRLHVDHRFRQAGAHLWRSCFVELF